MRPSFNVLTEPWISVVSEEGKNETLGICETIKRAHELRSISEVSPLAEYGIHRVLSLFLMDALRPEDKTDIEELLDEGQFSMETIDGYIEQCLGEKVSFDLFDKERPFLQSAFNPAYDKERKPASTLDCTLPTGNNHVHFDHRSPGAVKLTPAEAVKLVITAQLFCTAGAQGYPSNVSGAPPYYAVVHGKNLFETLVYELTPVNEMSIPFDNPSVLWRSKDEVQAKKEVSSTSYLRGSFFPTRRILLLPEDDGTVSEVYYSQGENYTEMESWRDPAVTYRATKEAVAPLRPHKDMPLWRNLDSLADIPGEHAPKTLRQYQSLSRNRYVTLTLYGIETSNAAYLNIMRSDLRLPLNLCTERVRIEWLTALLSDSTQLVSDLRKAVGKLSEKCVGTAAEAFFTACEKLLWLCSENVAECGLAELPAIRVKWIENISEEAMNCLQNTVSSLKLRGRELAKAAEAQKSLYFAINKMKKGAEK